MDTIAIQIIPDQVADRSPRIETNIYILNIIPRANQDQFGF